jgi:hypothetical protein
MVVGAGEIFGRGIAPIIAGTVAQNYGIQNILWVAMSGVVLGVVVAVFPARDGAAKGGDGRIARGRGHALNVKAIR